MAAFFEVRSFMPHGHCYFWSQDLITLHVVSDALIVLAYYSIPLTLIYFVRKHRDLNFDWMFMCFAVFIMACGTTHLMEIWNVWHGEYWLSGSIKALTALASVPTAILLVKLVPKALALPTPTQLLRINEALQAEIAERKKSEEIARNLNRELELRARQLEAANKELEAFSYSVSHDLRAPLRGVDAYVRILQEDYANVLDAEGNRLITVARREARRMGRLIDDLLSFSRVAREEMAISVVDMTSLAQSVVDTLKGSLPVPSVRFDIGALPEAWGDRAMLRQVFTNLIGNAIKFSGKRTDSIIEISGEMAADEVRFHVRDNGVGFDEKYGHKLFGVFQRLHSEKEFEGTGVGLALVQRIIAKHGGRVWAEGKLDAGAVFHFALPLREGGPV
ncbi:MAG TPA: ATP-binding protein [Candidatus Limnocylindria bacterium]|nr:ATP-binding protein [Candidatus Limnocylindria bacterium]